MTCMLAPRRFSGLSESRRDILQREEMSASAVEVYTVFGDGGENLLERCLYIIECSHLRKARSEDIEFEENLGGIFVAFVVAQVVVTALLAAKSGRTAGGAVKLGIVAEGNGHESLRKMGC